MQDYITTLASEFERHQDPQRATQQKAYMRHQFEFWGIPAKQVREIGRPFLAKAHLPPKDHAFHIATTLWTKPEREFQYFAIDLLLRYTKQLEQGDIIPFVHLITHKSWWDTVDILAYKFVGGYFSTFPETIMHYVDQWVASGNRWLQRTALLFQLNYKDQLDTKVLSYCIEALRGSDEFFIRKAIGWVLRQYSKTNPDWVVEFVANTALKPLSSKEALRLIR